MSTHSLFLHTDSLNQAISELAKALGTAEQRLYTEVYTAVISSGGGWAQAASQADTAVKDFRRTFKDA